MRSEEQQRFAIAFYFLSTSDRTFCREAIAFCIKNIKEKYCMIKALPLFASVTMVGFSQCGFDGLD